MVSDREKYRPGFEAWAETEIGAGCTKRDFAGRYEWSMISNMFTVWCAAKENKS